MFALKQTEKDWVAFLNDDSIWDKAQSREKAWQSAVQLEKEVARVTGLFDIFCDPDLSSDPQYIGELASLHCAFG